MRWPTIKAKHHLATYFSNLWRVVIDIHGILSGGGSA